MSADNVISIERAKEEKGLHVTEAEAFLLGLIQDGYITADADEKGQAVFRLSEQVTRAIGVCVNAASDGAEIITLVLPSGFDEMLRYDWEGYEVRCGGLVLWARARIEGRFWAMEVPAADGVTEGLERSARIALHPYVEHCHEIDLASEDGRLPGRIIESMA